MNGVTDTPSYQFVCPLCELTMKNCQCGSVRSARTDSSCTLLTNDQNSLCSICGKFVMNCFCDFYTHSIIMETGVCGRCGLDNPGNQICGWSVDGGRDIVDTPSRGSDMVNPRRNLFKVVQSQFISISEGSNGFTRGEFEVYHLRADHDHVVTPGQTASVKSNIVVTPPSEEIAGFLSVTNQHPSYWLHKPCSTKNFLKEGVLSTAFNGYIHVSVMNKSDNLITLRAGSILGCVHFNRFL